MIRRQERRRLPPDPPNIVVILLDDVGFGLPDTFGGVFHSPTQAARLTGSLRTRLHPQDRVKIWSTKWTFHSTSTRMREFAAPLLGRDSNSVTIDAELGPNASGVPYALGGAGGGLVLYLDKGQLVKEYNMMMIERYSARSAQTLRPGTHRIEVETTLKEKRPLSSADVILKVDGKEAAHTTVGDRARRLQRE